VLLVLACALLLPVALHAQANAGRPTTSDDPRVGLRAGWMDAGEAIRNMELVAQRPRPEGFVNPANPGDFGFANSDIAFQGSYLYLGNFNGVQIYDISDPANPRLRSTIVCPGGQGDVSVYGDLLFMSVEETRGRVDCGPQGTTGQVSPARFRGVRIFDVSNLDAPRQVAAVQTCRGSHTHTLLPDQNDERTVYVYVSGTSVARTAEELAGCSPRPPAEDPNTSYYRIEVIRVSLDAPQDARVVSEPRIFADRETGDIAGLWPGGRHGEGTQATAGTNMCHDITVYPAIGLAAGACSGNGILLDIRDPVNPVRIDEVIDPNFAYWHSATFSNDGRTVIFTDEWGGGTAARCRETDRREWGANALFHLEDGKMRLAGYYKLPAPQTAQENCVAHNGSLVPVPGRDIKVQAWYQGGVSVFDFTDPANAVEIAYFDRGPLSAERLLLGGHWSTYWYNGYIYGSEIARGLDVLRLVPSEHLSQNEIDAAKLVRTSVHNPQTQERITWPAHISVAKAFVDQLARNEGLPRARTTAIMRELDAAQRLTGERRTTALTRLATQLDGDARNARDADRVRKLVEVIRQLAQEQQG
jgi:hypothetical protein